MRQLVAATAAVFFMGGLFAQTLSRDYDHSVDFSSLKKFGWIQRDALPIVRADPSLHDPATDAALNRLVLDSLKSHLEQKGFVLDEESPDFLVEHGFKLLELAFQLPILSLHLPQLMIQRIDRLCLSSPLASGQCLQRSLLALASPGLQIRPVKSFSAQ